MNFTKIANTLAKGNKFLFDISVAEQKAFLEKLGEGRNDIDRSYKQYRCQNFFVPFWKRLALNFVSIIAFPFGLLFFWIKSIGIRRGKHIDACADFKSVEEVIPEVLRNEYEIDDQCSLMKGSLTLRDSLYLLGLAVRYPQTPFFSFKNLIKVAKYSYLIHVHTPRTIMVHDEFSFTSSLLTDFCHRYGVKQINIMHGEKMFYIRDSYFHYDECYVWDEYYAKLFKKMKAELTQFKVVVPKSLIIDTVVYHEEDHYADYKYYLDGCSEEDLKSIVASMQFATKDGKTVKYRPHPRYSDMAMVVRTVGKENIEYPCEVFILSSIANVSVAVGSYTTVLNQAIHSGKQILLDDVTFKSQYDKLKELEYIFANEGYPRLSERQG